MAGPAFRTVGTAASSASAASLSPTLPAVDQNGNGILIAIVWSANNAAHSCGTAGWAAAVAQQNSGASFTASVWKAAQSAGAPGFTWTGAAACVAIVFYASDPQAVTDLTIGATSASTGSANPHTSTSVTTTHDKSAVLLLDVAAGSATLSTPSGWTADFNDGDQGGEISVCEKKIATGGSASGATSATGANAAWVAWQIEIMEVQPAAGLQSSRIEAAPWYAPPAGLASPKVEAAPWYWPPRGLASAKIEAGLWLVKFPELPLLVYPTLKGIAVDVHERDHFYNTKPAETSTGAKIVLGLSDTPLHFFDLKYNFLRGAMTWQSSPEYETLRGFFGAVRGNLLNFKYRHPRINRVASQSIGTGDGSTRLFTLPMTFGSGDYAWTEPIGFLDDTQSPKANIYLDSGGGPVLQDPSTYSLQLNVGSLQQVLFNSAPANTVKITGDYGFFFNCKLDDPEGEWEKMLLDLYLINKITLRSCRAYE